MFAAPCVSAFVCVFFFSHVEDYRATHKSIWLAGEVIWWSSDKLPLNEKWSESDVDKISASRFHYQPIFKCHLLMALGTVIVNMLSKFKDLNIIIPNQKFPFAFYDGKFFISTGNSIANERRNQRKKCKVHSHSRIRSALSIISVIIQMN